VESTEQLETEEEEEGEENEVNSETDNEQNSENSDETPENEVKWETETAENDEDQIEENKEVNMNTNIFETEKEPMKSIIEQVEEQNYWKWELYPVNIDDKNQINFVSTNGLNDYTNYIVFRYNYQSEKITKETVKNFSYDFLTNSSEMDLPVSNLIDVWWKDYGLFKDLVKKERNKQKLIEFWNISSNKKCQKRICD